MTDFLDNTTDWRGESLIRSTPRRVANVASVATPQSKPPRRPHQWLDTDKLQRLANLAQANPAITKARVAEILECTPGAVSKAARRLGLTFPDGRQTRHILAKRRGK